MRRLLRPGPLGWASQGGWPPLRLGPRDPLARFRTSGTIGVYYSTDAVTRDAQGRVTAMKNLGGFGAVLDAAVSGPALVQQGATLVFPEIDSSHIQLPVTLDACGVHLMWLMSGATITQGMRLFGHSGPPDTTISFGRNTEGVIINLVHTQYANASTSPRFLMPDGLSVYELRMTAAVGATPGQVDFYLNGVIVASGTHAFPEFQLSRLGVGLANFSFRFRGRLGEIIAPILGRPDSAQAVIAARARLMTKRAVG